MPYYRVKKFGEKNPIAQGCFRSIEEVREHVIFRLIETGKFQVEVERKGLWFPSDRFTIGDIEKSE